MKAHNESGFDSYVVLNNLPRWRSVVKLIKNGAVILSLRKFDGYTDEKKKNLQYIHFRCGKFYIKKIKKK